MHHLIAVPVDVRAVVVSRLFDFGSVLIDLAVLDNSVLVPEAFQQKLQLDNYHLERMIGMTFIKELEYYLEKLIFLRLSNGECFSV
jgi:hypothetical protein